jgi:hypothetical protein
MKPTMRYDSEDDILMIWLAHGKTIDHAEQFGTTILHVSAEDEPVLLEILEARAFMLEMLGTALSAPAGEAA